ncbi:phosphatase PAP2 family protein [Thermosulfurimonas sp.]|uniref:phosphatase PAP2 family protein n=1 Tax=Thermosulfurimonas sp. TaxID=2080236 RepID=UPI0025F2E87E|nr:phosphatase PAP2 family protein [Thermosulfurimonas sp.]
MSLFTLLNTPRGPLWDRVMVLLSRPDLIVAFFVFLGLVLVVRKGRGMIGVPLVALLMVILADALCARVLKPYFARPRPYALLSGVRVYKGGRFRKIEHPLRARHYGFPSCHATNTAAATGVFWMADPILGIIAAGFSFMVGLSRVYLGHHFPEDVLFGWIIGAGIGLTGGLLWRKWKKTREP